MNNNIFSEIDVYRPEKFRDERGEIWTIYQKNGFDRNIEFVHTKFSISGKNVIRGIHGDFSTWKLISCIYGKIYFVVVDNRNNSSKYYQHDWMILDDQNRDVVLIPPGFGNGFCVLSDKAIFSYLLSYTGKYSDVEDQFTLKWDSPDFNIDWPIDKPILSDRDK